MALVKWIDLSSVGVHFGSYRDANKQAGVALVDTIGRHHDAIVAMGFRPASGAFQSGIYLKADHAITPAALRAAFGSDAVRFFVAEQATIIRDFNNRIKELTSANSKAVFAQQRPIGMNHLGEIVQESVIGRYVVRAVDGVAPVLVREDDAGGAPEMFLRAQDQDQLRRVAKGFVMRIVARKESLRRDHVARLMDVSNVGQFTARQYQEAIEIGLNELYAEGLASLAADAAPLAAFDLAHALYLGMPELKERTPNSIANQQYSTTLPIAALAQAMLGPRASLNGATVLDPTIGNGNLVAGLNVGRAVDERCKVFGVEIDPARVDAVQEVVDQVILGDATKVDFRKLFNAPAGFDFVVANPPFGSLPQTREVSFPAGSLADSMTVGRLDQLILLDALHARAEDGRAVFITGADSVVESGEVTGRSRYLLNYLCDHYEVDGVVDVSGELYKKQGAQFPIRLYVIGSRKVVPAETARPEKLEVIRTYEGLRTWAAAVISAHGRHEMQARPLGESAPDDDLASPVDDVAQVEAADVSHATLSALFDLGWQNQSGAGNKIFWVTKTIGGGYRSMVNPDGDRRLSAKIQDGRMLAKHGDGALIDLPYDDSKTPLENATALDAAVNRIDPRSEVGASADVREVVVVRDTVNTPRLPDSVRSIEGNIAMARWDNVMQSETGELAGAARDERLLTAFVESLGHLWSARLENFPDHVRELAHALANTMVFGQMADTSFAGAVKRIEMVARLMAEELTDIGPSAVKVRGTGADAFRRAAGGVRAEKGRVLGNSGRFAAMLLVQDKLYAAPDMALSTARDAAMARFDAMADDFEASAVRLDVRASEQEEADAQRAFSEFDPASLKMPTASALGLPEDRRLVLFEGVAGWSNGEMLDVNMRPRMVVDAITKYYGGDEANDRIRNLPERSCANLMQSVQGNDVVVEPVAGYQMTSSKAGPIVGSGLDMRREPPITTRIDGVVFVNEDRRHAVILDRRYVGYFKRMYPGAVYVASGVSEQVAVKVVDGGRDVGVIMPIRAATDKVFDRALIARGSVAHGNSAEADVDANANAGPQGDEEVGGDVGGVVKKLGVSGAEDTDELRKMLKKTLVRGRLSDLAGPSNAETRSLLLARALGVERVPKAQAGINALREALFAVAGIGGDETLATQEAALAAWIGANVDVVVPAAAAVVAPDVGVSDESAIDIASLDGGNVESMSVDEMSAVPAVLPQRVDARQESAFQQRYIAFSNVSEPDTMIPANLSGPVYEALAAIKAAHGDIDEYVARELDYAVGDLEKYFKAEQVDAMAMIFHATDRHLGFLLGDSMGVGKGRVLAGVARRERIQGRIPVFVTVTPSLFSDFLERDIAMIDSRELFANPMIVNDGCKTVDANGDVVVRAMNRPAYKRFAESGALPDGTDMILLTYSQISRRGNKSLTTRYMNELAHRYPISLLLDESHNGAGASNTSENLEAMIDAIGRRGTVVYSSGTAIKGAKNLRLYKKILPAGVDHDELLAVVESDPLALQEALNYEIAAQGCMISRELDNTGIEKQYVLSQHTERNRALADEVASIFSAMCFLSGDVAKVVGNLNKEFRKELEKLSDEEREGSRMGASNLNFGSRLHELNRQFLMAVKAGEIVDRTILALEANKKPIISLQHTGEAMLVDFVTKSNEVYDQESADRTTKQLQSVILERPVTFKDLLNKYLEKISWIKIQGRYGDVSFKQVETKEFEAATKRITGLIDDLPDDLPLIPIDFVRERLARRGFSVAEVSGRGLMSRTLEDGRVSIEPVPDRTDKTRINRAVREFNNGDADVLMLTGSGSTGLSAQASPAVGKDVRVRVMIKWEMQPDIAKERQMDGRHNRTGQIVLPEYEVLLSGLPADDRLSMMFNNKNRSLSSSTVANRDSKDLIREVPDLLNEVGDMAAADLLYEDPTLAAALDIDLPECADEKASKSNLWYCTKLSGRLSLLPVVEQERVYADWQGKFVEKLDALKAQGRNPLEVEYLDWKATVVGRDVFMGTPEKADGAKSSFSSPVYISTLSYEKEVKAVRAENVDLKIRMMNVASALGMADGALGTICHFLKKHRRDLLTKSLSKKHATIEGALDDKNPNEVQNMARKLDWIAENLPRLRAGAVFADHDAEGRVTPTVILDYRVPNNPDAFSRLSDYCVYTMQPGTDVVGMQTLSGLFSRNVAFDAVTFADHQVVRERFDKAEDGIVVKQARVFDGNLFEATALNLRSGVGRKIVYTDHAGTRQHGILIRANVSMDKLDKLPEKIRDPAFLVTLLARTPITTDTDGDWREPGHGIVIKAKSADEYEIAVPLSKARGGEVYLDPVLSKITGSESENKFSLNFSSKAGKMSATVERRKILELLTYLVQEKNNNFYSKERAMIRHVRSSMEKVNEQSVGVR